ncbi:hypothetical protein [Leptothoe kymatousa]|uniref:Toxin co-regulated pilus biosynthesis protein Q C-terminal domain-containing protein n=1 Tax=Leptothoe kymatousa TAU-MAC 1615 TaxID=2364775 RepID=A0ABS5Y710_9CYAN|nr:hypothetical protein [Leptothoe kymatousa]MBT9313288.1 hypothetical protein [Leptothoe kymatousa TAU-MAC 1615]
MNLGARWIAIASFGGAALGSGHALATSPPEAIIPAVRQINNEQPVTDIPPSATADAPSERSFTVPSLWWQQQQQGNSINQRLIDTWSAYDSSVSAIPHVDVLVNGQIWPLLNYLEQYAFITQFGESAKAYGYQLRIFTGNRLVGLHVCQFSEAPSFNADTAANPNQASQNSADSCRVELDYFGQGAIRGGRRR